VAEALRSPEPKSNNGHGLAAAKANGKRLGRPRRVVDSEKIALLRSRETPWRKIAAELGVGVGITRARFNGRAKNPPGIHL